MVWHEIHSMQRVYHVSWGVLQPQRAECILLQSIYRVSFVFYIIFTVDSKNLNARKNPVLRFLILFISPCQFPAFVVPSWTDLYVTGGLRPVSTIPHVHNDKSEFVLSILVHNILP